MQSKNINLREMAAVDPTTIRMEQVNLNDPDELEAQLELLDVVRSRRPESPRKKLPGWKLMCCRIFICIVIIVPFVAAIMVDQLKRENIDKASPPNPILTPAPANLKSTCAAQFISGDVGLQECKRACEVAECCDFPANMALSCLKGNEEACLEYHASCSILVVNATVNETDSIPESIEEAPTGLKDICNSASLATPDGFMACQMACKGAECCYESNNVSPSCALEREFKCQPYAPCLTLAATDHVHENIVKEIKRVCSTDQQKCQEACSHAQCCFATMETPDIQPCLHDHTDWCLQYEPCRESLLNNKEEDETFVVETEVDTMDETDTTTNDEETVHAADIRQACVDSPEPSKCKDLCDPGECCFHHHGCDDSTHDVAHCTKYASCFVNYGETDDDDVVVDVFNTDAVDIAKACHDSSPNEVGPECVEMCKESKCCFTTDKDCGDETTHNCDMYAPCYVLYEQTSGATEKIATKEFVEVDEETNNNVEMDEYSDVGVHNDVVAANAAPASVANIAEACRDSTPVNVQPRCEAACEAAKCCFVPHDCKDSNSMVASCDEYGPCSVLYGVTEDDDFV